MCPKVNFARASLTLCKLNRNNICMYIKAILNEQKRSISMNGNNTSCMKELGMNSSHRTNACNVLVRAAFTARNTMFDFSCSQTISGIFFCFNLSFFKNKK